MYWMSMKKIIPTLLGLVLATSSFATINTVKNDNGTWNQFKQLSSLDEGYMSDNHSTNVKIDFKEFRHHNWFKKYITLLMYHYLNQM